MSLIDKLIMWNCAISSFGSISTRPAVWARRKLALQIKVDVAWSDDIHMIALRINLMNISVVTTFFGQGSNMSNKKKNKN